MKEDIECLVSKGEPNVDIGSATQVAVLMDSRKRQVKGVIMFQRQTGTLYRRNSDNCVCCICHAHSRSPAIERSGFSRSVRLIQEGVPESPSIPPNLKRMESARLNLRKMSKVILVELYHHSAAWMFIHTSTCSLHTRGSCTNLTDQAVLKFRLSLHAVCLMLPHGLPGSVLSIHCAAFYCTIRQGA